MVALPRAHGRWSARSRADEAPEAEAVEQLRSFQAVTEAVLAHSSDLVIFFEVDGTIDWVSPSILKAFGVEPDVLVGRNCFDIVHPDDRTQASLDFASILDLGDSIVTEFRIEIDGTVRWVEGALTNLLDEPNVGRIVGNVRDVTERKEAAEALLFHTTLLAAVGQAIVAVDNGGHILYWNDAAEALYGWPADVAVGQRFDLLVPAAEGWDPSSAEEILGGSSWSGELRVVARSGRVVPIMATSRPVLGFDGRPIATTVVSIDIADQLRQRQKDDDARRRLAEAQESARLGSFEIDLVTGEVTRSPELWRIIGYEPGSLTGVHLEHVHPDDRAMVEAAIHAAISGEPDISCTHRIVRPDGTVRWVLSRTRASRPSEGSVLSGTMLDVTERHQAELALAHQATHDPLTGLGNRRKLVDELERAIAEDGTGATAVLYCDLDDFKAVNDRLGHVAADEVLRAVGGRLTNLVEPGDTVARLGGDEFVVCCRDVHDRPDLIRRAERLRLALLEPVQLGGDTIDLSASIGVAACRPASTAEDVLREADTALYEAKQGRGGRLVVFDDALHAEVLRRQQLTADIDEALRSGQFDTYFQPEVALSTGTLLGFEALARWHHPVHGTVAPSEFIELAERSRAIGQLGRKVLRDACAALATWIDRCPEQRLSVALNVSPIQLADPTFPLHVRNAIADAGVPAGRVCLEVTESTLMDSDVATRALRELKAIGVSIAIDDFGTGYSSLARLKRFPVDLLKIDRTFVDGLGSDPEDEVIVATVVKLARSLGLDVIAEGVETDEQLQILARLGCERGQGFLWSPALPLGAATAYASGQDTLRHAPPPDGGDRTPMGHQTRSEDHAATNTMAAIVHELATPLTVIRGYADLARYLPAPDDGQMLDVALGAIGRSADDIATIMQTMTDVRSLEEGTLVLDREPLDVVRLLSEIIAERAMAEASNPISLRDDDPVLVVGDATRCRQIFINLLANAATWSPDGAPIEILVDIGDATASISVIDQGPGVAADRIGDLFRMFARPDRSRTGTGLGLYVARSLARGQGGDIRYRRAAGRGSEFIVDLPRCLPA